MNKIDKTAAKEGGDWLNDYSKIENKKRSV